jgi:DNA invertase Pin-like site-specific DNA recombinase
MRKEGCTKIPPDFGRSEISKFNGFCNLTSCVKKRLVFVQAVIISVFVRHGNSLKRAALYLRVSTLDQATANQKRELREVASRIGCEIVKVYKDHGISGAKGRDKRPAFDALCRDAAQRRFDLVMAWSVDRLGRSLQDLISFLSELHSLGIDLFLHQQGLDTTTPSGKAMFQMLGVFAEFERAMIQERVRAGLARARAEGKQLGRPKIAEQTERAVVSRAVA